MSKERERMKAVEQTYGKWNIVREIGKGSFGTVYEIKREEFNHTYRAALKVITIPQERSEIAQIRSQGMSEADVTEYYRDVVENCVQEIALMSQMQGHTNVVNYQNHEVRAHEDGLGWDILLRMELLTSLSQYITEHVLTLKDVVQIGIDVCSALERCQKLGIIHRDIKPANIFVSEQGDFKLGDFGIARTAERTMSGMSRKGTFPYMAPEVYLCKPYSYRADIYSLGMVLYHLLNDNRGPFMPPVPEKIRYQDSEQALTRRMKGEPFPLPSQTQGRLAEIVLKACAYAPEERYATPAQMRADLEAFLKESAKGDTVMPLTEEAESSETQSDQGTPLTDEGTVSIWDEGIISQENGAEPEPEPEEEPILAVLETPEEEPIQVIPETPEEETIQVIPETLEEETIQVIPETLEEEPIQVIPEMPEEEPIQVIPEMPEEEPIQVIPETPEEETIQVIPETPEEETIQVIPETPKEETEAPANEDSKKPQGWKKIGLIACAVLVLLCGSVFGTYRILTVPVPDVVDLSIAEAEEVLKAKGLFLEEGKATYSEETEKGNIASCAQAGKRAMKGDVLTVSVSLGKQTKLKDYTGKQAKKVNQTLTKRGITVKEKKQYSTQYAKGTVIQQSLKKGTKLEEGDEMTLTISKGPKPVKLEDFTGLSEQAAVEKAEKLNLQVKTKKAFSTTAQKGNVAEQTPKAGKTIQEGDTLTLTISKGAEQVTVPNLLGKTRAEAESALNAAGLTVGTVTNNYSSSYAYGKVCTQGRTAGTTADKGSAVNFGVSIGAKPVYTPKKSSGSTKKKAKKKSNSNTVVVNDKDVDWW